MHEETTAAALAKTLTGAANQIRSYLNQNGVIVRMKDHLTLLATSNDLAAAVLDLESVDISAAMERAERRVNEIKE